MLSINMSDLLLSLLKAHLNTDLHIPVLPRPSCLSLQLTHLDLAKGKRLHIEIEVVLLIPVHMTSMSVSILGKTLELKVLTGKTVHLGGQTWLSFYSFFSESHTGGEAVDPVSTKWTVFSFRAF